MYIARMGEPTKSPWSGGAWGCEAATDAAQAAAPRSRVAQSLRASNAAQSIDPQARTSGSPALAAGTPSMETRNEAVRVGGAAPAHAVVQKTDLCAHKCRSRPAQFDARMLPHAPSTLTHRVTREC